MFVVARLARRARLYAHASNCLFGYFFVVISNVCCCISPIVARALHLHLKLVRCVVCCCFFLVLSVGCVVVVVAGVCVPMSHFCIFKNKNNTAESTHKHTGTQSVQLHRRVCVCV